MLTKRLVLTAVLMLGIGLSQAWAMTPAETANKAAESAAAAASKAAGLAADSHQKLTALEKNIADKQAAIKALEDGSNPVALKKAQEELKKLVAIKTDLVKFVAQLDGAAAQAQTAANAAHEAALRASAQGVTPVDAKAAANMAVRQAGLADSFLSQAVTFTGAMNKWIDEGGFRGLLTPGGTTDTTVKKIPRPGNTPTEIGHGRRGVL